jgi:hypothetical protein
MSRDEDDKPAVARSDGEDEARAYAEAEVPEPSLTPTMEMDRVQVVDPRRAPTMRREDMLKASGPRAPEQTAPSAPATPGVEAPLGLPGNKLQPLLFDQEFLEELRRKRAEAGEGKDLDPEEKAHETPGNSPWSREAPPAEPVRASALPSSFAPRPAPDATAGEKPARKRSTATTAITVALAAVGVALLVLASTRTHTTESGSPRPATAATATATATATTVAPAVPEVVTPPRPPPVEPAAPPAASATSAAAAALPGARVVPATPTKASSEAEDPYPDGVKPIPAAVRSAAPVVVPTKAPPTATSAHPAPVSTVGKLVGGEE